MRAALLVGLAGILGACTVERVGPPGVTLTRPVTVRAQNVAMFGDAGMVSGHYSVVDQVYVRDDGDEQPRVLQRRLRELGGARGANAIILDPRNRRANGTRVDLHPTLDDPFDQFQATAIWIGDEPPPQRFLRPDRASRRTVRRWTRSIQHSSAAAA